MLLSSISLLKMGNIQNMIQPSGHTVSRLPRERERERVIRQEMVHSAPLGTLNGRKAWYKKLFNKNMSLVFRPVQDCTSLHYVRVTIEIILVFDSNVYFQLIV